MAQQTAVKWLEDQLSEWIHYEYEKAYEQHQKVNGIFEQAKQMEKEQIITASSIGILWGEDEEQLQSSVKFGEEYYDRTFISTPQGETPSATRIGQS
jgi:hypothetical protein